MNKCVVCRVAVGRVGVGCRIHKVGITRLSQPSLAGVGAGAELGNIAGIPLRLISGISHTSYSYISGIR